MQEHLIIGKWRSYKTFCHHGTLKRHSTSLFIEINIDDQRMLTIKLAPCRPRSVQVQTVDWEIREDKNKDYLYIEAKQVYEIITLEADDLVLEDIANGEKLFFARPEEWHMRLQPTVRAVDKEATINIWSKSLIELFQE